MHHHSPPSQLRARQRHHEWDTANTKKPHHVSGGATTPHPREANPLERSIDLVVGLAESFEDGLAGPEPRVIVRRPYQLRGSVEIAGHRYDYVSGGAGWSIPFGDWRIDDSEGSWGRRHGALGLNDDSIPDHYLGRDREGIEIHADRSGRTEGCFGVEQWPAFKRAVMAMIATYGNAYLHIRPDGASVTPIKEADPFVMEAQIREEEVHHEVHHRREHLAERHRRWAHRHYAAR